MSTLLYRPSIAHPDDVLGTLQARARKALPGLLALVAFLAVFVATALLRFV